MNTLQPQNNPEELTTLARELSSPKDTEKLWQEVQNEWAEFFEQEARMTNAKDSIERRQILPYYLDELADVWWNIAKLRAFSDAGLTAEQQEIITQAEKKRTYGDTITARATKKYRERYGALK